MNTSVAHCFMCLEYVPSNEMHNISLITYIIWKSAEPSIPQKHQKCFRSATNSRNLLYRCYTTYLWFERTICVVAKVATSLAMHSTA